MAKKLFTVDEAKERHRANCRIAMRKKRAKSPEVAEAIVKAHQAAYAADREARKIEIDPQLHTVFQYQRVERQRLINMQEELFDDRLSKLEKQKQLQGELVGWLEVNSIHCDIFWEIYEKLRECEVRIAALNKSSEYGKHAAGLMEYSTFNLRSRTA